jgi:hypothetical protein
MAKVSVAGVVPGASLGGSMSARTMYLSRLIGTFAIIVGLSMFARRADFANIMMLMTRDQALLYVVGIGALGVGLAIVLAHNVWSGLAAIVITLIGWLSILRGIAILFLSGGLESNFFASINFGALATFYACIFVIVGAYLTYTGFSARAEPTA